MKGLDRRVRRIKTSNEHTANDLSKLSDAELLAELKNAAAALSDLHPQVLFCTGGNRVTSDCNCGKCHILSFSVPEIVTK